MNLFKDSFVEKKSGEFIRKTIQQGGDQFTPAATPEEYEEYLKNVQKSENKESPKVAATTTSWTFY